MKLPVIEGIVERRLLVNYRVDPGVVGTMIPAPFRPQLVNGWAVAGICLIRLGHLRPNGWPRQVGLRSENAAHRIAVEWDDPQSRDGTATGVYIPRRDTGSLPNALIGGRLFPGEHHRAKFTNQETADTLRVAFVSTDRTVSVDVVVEPADNLGDSRLFHDVDEASAFFQQGSVGYSATGRGHQLDGLELRTNAWQAHPARVTSVRSTFFDSADQFPPGTATLDCALLMRGVPVTWHPRQPLHLPAGQNT
ncbi:MAG: DUF2071 domain-containing protein [Acidimicrobiales bacterium]